MSEEKTKVTHSSKPVRYLGYDFKVIHSKNMKRCKNGDMETGVVWKSIPVYAERKMD